MSQNYKNHAKFVPLYHYFLTLLVLAYLVFSCYRLYRDPRLGTAMGLVLAVILVLTYLYARLFALAVQDRVIRLEMRLRLSEILPPELEGRIMEISPSHLIGLRFASDAEMPDLVRQVLDGNLTSCKAIKLSIKDWQGDHYRA